MAIRWIRDKKETGLRAVVQSKNGRGWDLKDMKTDQHFMRVFKDQATNNWRFLVIRPGREKNAHSKKEWENIEDALAVAKKWWAEVGSKAAP